MRTFEIIRHEDVSGVSGTGKVAEGVEFHDGQCVISWFGEHHICEVSTDINTWLAVHGHGEKTTVNWLEFQGEPEIWTKKLRNSLRRWLLRMLSF